ncbi:MAG: fasciclin domain-containing protein [Bacteroidaceae bacterium]|nr:fasciclin domain-containing protein [Bacteroidaceae bacterium]
MKNTYYALLVAVLAVLLTGCKEDVDMSNRYTFTQYTITSYLEEHESTYSEYLSLLKAVSVSRRSESTLYQLLSARGNYTVFAPTNQAIHDYLDSLVVRGIIAEPSWDAFTDAHKLDSIQKVIVFNSVIDGGDDVPAYQTSTFVNTSSTEGNGGIEIALPNMYDRKLRVYYGAVDLDSIFINKTALISLKNRDIPAINGYIHSVEGVIAPRNETLADVFHTMLDEGKGGFVVMARLIQACGLLDTLSREKDEVYEALYENEEIEKTTSGVPTENCPSYLPEHRKYGFTIFAETDNFWEGAIGKEASAITVQDIRNYIQRNNLCPGAVDDENYTSEDNALNQFVTYHLLPMKLVQNKLTIHFTEKGYNWKTSTSYTIPVWEIYTTMGKRRLLKIYEPGPSGPDGYYLNRFPNLNNGRHGNYRENGCDPDKEGIHLDIPEDMEPNTLINAVIYPINRVLAYDDDTRDNFMRNRIRFDITSIFPEFMNNDIRPDYVGTQVTKHVAIPTNEKYPYLSEVEIGSKSMFNYLSGRGSNWANYQGDELNVIGKYELTFRLPPVPRRGTYEIRYLVGAGSSARSMCQVYFGTDKKNMPAQGIPLDLRMGGLYRHTAAGDLPSIVGWEQEQADDDDYNAEVEKKMRANGFMKGPNYYNLLTNTSWTARDCEYTTRRIIVTATMDPDVVYYLRFKNVLDDDSKQFYMDFLEFCPKEVYDNPYEPEDIW